MAEEHERRPATSEEPTAQSTRGRHPDEEGDVAPPPAVPEDDQIVPNRHSASAEAAWLRWRESHDED
jgi:hypothetical protein